MDTVARHPAADAPLLKRLWLYQEERFPVMKTATLLCVFSAASIAVSAHLAGRPLPGLWTFAVAWAVTVIVFFQMRACDEWKDLDDDRTYRPERPVPSGLVSLRLILGLGFAGIPLGAALVASHAPVVLMPLALVWLWLGLMTMEFFVPEWLKARPFLYLVSHMAIMPLIDLFITATEWLPHASAPPAGLWIFLALSFVNGCVIEIGRKVWAPESEREGVETYSALLGPVKAARIWVAATAGAFCLLILLGFAVGAPIAVAIPGAIALAVVVWIGLGFARNPTVSGQKKIDLMAGLWVFVCYTAAGFAPLAAAGFGS